MRRTVKKLKVLLMAVMICAPLFLMAQGPGFGGGGDDVEDVPFDGGVSLLVAAGIGFGLKKAREKKKGEKAKQPLCD